VILRWVVVHLSLIELIEFDVTLEEELDKYEGKFERNEILDLKIYHDGMKLD
jgi:hypothetical protein